MDDEKTEWPNDRQTGSQDFYSGHEREQLEPDTLQTLGRQHADAATVDLRMVRIELIHPHPLNPRFQVDEELIKGCEAAARRRGGGDRTQPLVAREADGHLQLISGHHRFEGYQRAGLAEVMVHVVSLTDAEAMIALDTYNRHNPLGSLELARHAARLIEGGFAATQKDAAQMLDLDEGQVSRGLQALAVYEAHALNCDGSTHALQDHVEHLYVIRKLPSDAQKAIVERIVNEGLSKTDVQRLVAEHEQANGIEKKARKLRSKKESSESKAESRITRRDMTEDSANESWPADEISLPNIGSTVVPDADNDTRPAADDAPSAPKQKVSAAPTIAVDLTGHVNTLFPGDDVDLYPLRGPLPEGMALYVEGNEVSLAVRRGLPEPAPEPVQPEAEQAATTAEPTKDSIAITDFTGVLNRLSRVEPTPDLLERVGEIGGEESASGTWALPDLDPYQVAFGKRWARWFRQVIEFPDTKAKKKLQQLDIVYTDKVRATSPRPTYGSKAVVLLLAEHVLGIGRYDETGKAPAGSVAVVVDGHVVFVPAEHLECGQALIFRERKPSLPDWLEDP